MNPLPGWVNDAIDTADFTAWDMWEGENEDCLQYEAAVRGVVNWCDLAVIVYKSSRGATIVEWEAPMDADCGWFVEWFRYAVDADGTVFEALKRRVKGESDE